MKQRDQRKSLLVHLQFHEMPPPHTNFLHAISGNCFTPSRPGCEQFSDRLAVASLLLISQCPASAFDPPPAYSIRPWQRQAKRGNTTDALAGRLYFDADVSRQIALLFFTLAHAHPRGRARGVVSPGLALWLPCRCSGDRPNPRP